MRYLERCRVTTRTTLYTELEFPGAAVAGDANELRGYVPFYAQVTLVCFLIRVLKEPLPGSRVSF